MKLTVVTLIVMLACVCAQVVSSPAPLPVLQTSVLSNLVSSIPPGSWAQLNTIGIGSAVGTGPTAGNRIVFATSGAWDKTHQVFNFVGDDHLPTANWSIQYRAATNDWIAPDWGLGFGSHGYDNITINPATEELFFNQYGDLPTGNRVFSRPWNSAWAQKTVFPATMPIGITRGVAWWSGTFQGAGIQGALMLYNDGAEGGQILAYDPLSNQWFMTIGGFGGIATYSGIAEYSRIKNVMVFGSGNANAPKLWKLTSNRTVSAMPNAPVGVGSTLGQGNLAADPVSGNFIVYAGSKGVWSLNPDGAGLWTRLADAPSFIFSPVDTGNGPTRALISAPMYDLNAIFYVYCAGSSCYTAVYKPLGAGGGGSVTDFQRRCSEPGNVRCIGFDDSSDIAGGFGANTGVLNDGQAPPLLDPVIKSSGASSLMFTIPTHSWQNTSGSYFANFSPDLSVQFGANSTFYVQWRQRFDPNMLTIHYLGSKGWKQSVLGTGDKPGVPAYACTSIEVVTQNTFQRGFAQMYNSCTGSSTRPIPYWPFEPYTPSGTDLYLENARPAPYCLYSQQATSSFFPPTGNCQPYYPSEWMTFQVQVTLGNRVNDEWLNSNVRLWIAREGQPSQPVFDFDTMLVAGQPADDEKFGKIWLLPYQTDKDAAQDHPTAYTWYDELIISRNKISDPVSGGIPPSNIDLTPPTVIIDTPVR